MGTALKTVKNARNALEALDGIRKVLVHTDTMSYLRKGVRFEVLIWGDDVDQAVREAVPALLRVVQRSVMVLVPISQWDLLMRLSLQLLKLVAVGYNAKALNAATVRSPFLDTCHRSHN